MSRNNEGCESFLPLAMVGVLASVVFSFGSAVGRAGEHADERVKEVQTYNSEVYDQLAPAREVGKLVLTDGSEHTFSFQTHENGAAETCTGKYEVRNNAAVVVGNLTCTQVVTPAGRTS